MFENLARFDNSYAAYRAAVRHVLTEGKSAAPVADCTSIGSRFGSAVHATREIVGAGFVITNPRARLVFSPARAFDLAFAVGYVLWTLSGSNALADIAFYNPRGRLFSRDSKTLEGAIGPRLIGEDNGSQLQRAISYIRQDPGTRRAVVQVFSPCDLVNRPLDTPCTATLQFLFRDSMLTLIVYMRSQSVAFLLPYDIFTFSMIQEAVAVMLRCDVGDYVHFCGSLHFYDDEGDMVESLLDEEDGFAYEMPRMTSSPLEDATIVTAERESRRAVESGQLLDARTLGIDDYWADIINMTMVIVASKRGVRIPKEIKLHEAYARWSHNAR